MGTSPIPCSGYRPDARQAAATGLQSRTIKIAGVDRTFLRFVPATYDPDEPMSLVFGFHGAGGTSARARSTFDLEANAGGSAIFIYPQALPDAAGDNRWAADDEEGPDFAFVDELLRRTEANYCIDRDRVFATGFSNGARFTANLGCWRGDVLRAIAPVAPGGSAATLPFSDCVGEVAIWEGLGTLDSDHTAGATRVRDHYASANGCATTRTAITPSGCERYDSCRAEVPSIWCTYELGHQWPTIAPAGVMAFFRQLTGP